MDDASSSAGYIKAADEGCKLISIGFTARKSEASPHLMIFLNGNVGLPRRLQPLVSENGVERITVDA